MPWQVVSAEDYRMVIEIPWIGHFYAVEESLQFILLL